MKYLEFAHGIFFRFEIHSQLLCDLLESVDDGDSMNEYEDGVVISPWLIKGDDFTGREQEVNYTRPADFTISNYLINLFKTYRDIGFYTWQRWFYALSTFDGSSNYIDIEELQEDNYTPELLERWINVLEKSKDDIDASCEDFLITEFELHGDDYESDHLWWISKKQDTIIEGNGYSEDIDMLIEDDYTSFKDGLFTYWDNYSQTVFKLDTLIKLINECSGPSKPGYYRITLSDDYNPQKILEIKNQEKQFFLNEYGEFIDKKPNIIIQGSIFVFSGISSWNHQGENDHPIVQRVIERGGVYRTQVSGKTNYLVINPEAAGNSKINAAIEQRKKGKNIRIILIDDLLPYLDMENSDDSSESNVNSISDEKTGAVSSDKIKESKELLSFDDNRFITINDTLQIPVPDGYHYSIDGTGDNKDWAYIVPEDYSLNENHVDAEPLTFAVTKVYSSIGITFEAKIALQLKDFFVQKGMLNSNLVTEIYYCSAHCAFMYQSWVDSGNGAFNKINGFLFVKDRVHQFHIIYNHESGIGNNAGVIREFLELCRLWMGKVSLQNDEPYSEPTTPETVKDNINNMADLMEKISDRFPVQKDFRTILKEYYASLGAMFLSKKDIAIDSSSAETISQMTGDISGKHVSANYLNELLSKYHLAHGSISDYNKLYQNELIISQFVQVDKAANTNYVDGITEIHEDCVGLFLRVLCANYKLDFQTDEFYRECCNSLQDVIEDKWNSTRVEVSQMTNDTKTQTVIRVTDNKRTKTDTDTDTHTHTHTHTDELVTVSEAWTVKIPKGFKYSTEKSVIGDHRNIIIMENKKGNDFSDPFAASISFTSQELDGGGNGIFIAHQAFEFLIRGDKTYVCDDDSLFIAYSDNGRQEWTEDGKKCTLDKFVIYVGTPAIVSSIQVFFNDSKKSGSARSSLVDEVVRSISLKSGTDGSIHKTGKYTSVQTISEKRIGQSQSLFWLPKSWAMVKEKDCDISFGELEKYNGKAKAVILPEGLDEIGTDSFYGKDITAVFIPDGVTKIANDAFWDCKSLKTVLLPNSITEIGSSAFRVCEELAAIVIPDGCTDIGNDCFTYCKKLKDVYIPESVNYIGDDAFYTKNDAMVLHVDRGSYAEEYAQENDIAYDHKTAPDIESIRRQILEDLDTKKKTVQEKTLEKKRVQADNKFKELAGASNSAKEAIENEPETDRSQFKIVKNEIRKYIGDSDKVVIPSGITSIGDTAFKNKKGVVAIKVPDTVTSIGVSAFEKCQDLSYIDLPDSIKKINYYTFKGCNNLVSMSLPKGIETISNFAFDGCKNLKEIVFNDKVKELGAFVFNDCKALSSVIIPETLKKIDTHVFLNCTSLESVEILSPLKSIEKSMFSGCEKLKNIKLPDSVTIIGENAFYNCVELERIVLPKSLRTIENSAFMFCKKLKEIVIPEGVTELVINDSLFFFSDNVNTIYLPESLISIKNLKSIKDNVKEFVVYKDSYAEKVVKELKMKHKTILSERQKEEERLQREKTALEEEFRNCETEVNRLRSEISKAEAEIPEKSSELESIKETYEKKTGSRQEEEAMIEKKHQEEDHRLNGLLQELKNKKDELAREKSDKEKELSKVFFLLFSKKKRLRNEITGLEGDISTNERLQIDTSDKIRMNLKQKEKALEKIENDIKDSENKMNQLRVNLGSLTRETEKNRKKLKDKEEELTRLGDELKKYQ